MSARLGLLISLASILLAGCEVDVDEANRVPAQVPAATSNSDNPQAWKAAEPQQAPNLPQTNANVPFVKGFESGYGRATTAGKPMLVFFTAEWCHYCHQMADEIFTDPQVVGLTDRFVCILVDADAEPEVCKKFHVRGYPTVQFLSPRGAPLNRLVGKKPSRQVMTAMQAALQNVAQKGSTADQIR